MKEKKNYIKIKFKFVYNVCLNIVKSIRTLCLFFVLPFNIFRASQEIEEIQSFGQGKQKHHQRINDK